VSEQPNALVTEALDAVAGGRDLSAAEASAVLAEIMRGAVSPTQVAGFLIALRTKGETVDELAGLARTMRELAIRVDTRAGDLLDTAGTGGGRRSFNVSTTAALIAAGAGCAVAKHGNRSARSPSGSADVLEVSCFPPQATTDIASPNPRAPTHTLRRRIGHSCVKNDEDRTVPYLTLCPSAAGG